MNNISFTGLTNIRMGAGRQWKKGYGFYPAVTGEIKQGEKSYKDFKLHVSLINDAEAQDLDNLLSAMAEASVGYTTSYFKGIPNRVEILLRRFHAKDDIAKVRYSLFKINGEDVILSSRKALSLYTWLANVTRRISQMPDMTPRQKEFAQFMNRCVHEEAVKFIENM